MLLKAEPLYVFRPYRLDPRERQLLRNGEPVPLPPRAFDLLLALVARAGSLATKEELLGEVWAGTFVEETNLSYTISLLRKALGEGYIETVPKSGYRFIAPVSVVSTAPPDAPLAAPTGAKTRKRWSARWLGALVALGLVAVTAWIVWKPGSSRPSEPITTVHGQPTRPIRTLAVLPLQLNGDARQEYIAEGLTEALATALSRVRSLEINSSLSSRRYKHSDKSARAIATELGVDGLLEGSVTPSGKRVLIVVALVDARNDRKIWMKEYERDLGDVLSLFAEVANVVANQVSATITPEDQSKIVRRPITTETADSYFLAMYYRLRWQDGGCRRAVPLFERVIALEPDFDEVYAQLAWCYAFPDRTGQSVAVIEPKAKTAAETALRLNPDLARAHAVLGLIKWRLDYDWSLAEKEYGRAITLNPRDSQTLTEFGEYLYASGHLEQGLETVNRGLALDRFRLDPNVAFGFALYLARRYDDAIVQLRKTLDLDRNWATAQLWLAETLAIRGRNDEAVKEYLTWLRLVLAPGRVAATTEELSNVYHRRGWRAFWQKEIVLAEEEVRNPGTVWSTPYGRFCGSFFMARRYARLGDRDRTMSSLENAYLQRHHLIVFLKREPLFDQFQSDPRFRDLVLRAGIP